MALLSHTFDDNENSASVLWTGSADQRLTLGVELGGTFSGTLVVQHSEDDSTWMTLDVSVVASSSEEAKAFLAPSGYLRMSLTGATTPNFVGKIVPH